MAWPGVKCISSSSPASRARSRRPRWEKSGERASAVAESGRPGFDMSAIGTAAIFDDHPVGCKEGPRVPVASHSRDWTAGCGAATPWRMLGEATPVPSGSLGGAPMRWRDMRRSDNVEDRRGMSMGGAGHQARGRRAAPDPRAEPADGHEPARSPQRPGRRRLTHGDRLRTRAEAARGRSAVGLHPGDPRGHRGHVGPALRPGRRDVRAAPAGPVQRRASSPRAARRALRSGPSTARPTAACIWTSSSSGS